MADKLATMRINMIILPLMCCCFLNGQGRFVSVDGQRTWIKSFGNGEVTVVFESGMSDSIEVWGSIPDSVAKFAKVFLYDRADIGKSDTSFRERTIPNMVHELKSVLLQEHLDPPYILVGHSLGSLITRYFSSRYPEDVSGLLLLDPSPESYWNQMSKTELKEYIDGGNEWYQSKFEKRYWNEWYQFIPNLEYMKDLEIPVDLPIILVSASAWNWFEFQREIIAGFENAKQIELEGEHHIFQNHPDSIVNYIKELTEQ